MVLQNPRHCENLQSREFSKILPKNNPQFAPCFFHFSLSFLLHLTLTGTGSRPSRVPFPSRFAKPGREAGASESESVGPTVVRELPDLPPDLIHLISQKLPVLRYFIRCGAVCKRWFSSLISDPPRQQLRWLIEYTEQYPKASPLKRELQFYSFVSGETGSIPIHESHCGKVYRRPAGHSYLLVSDGGVISVLNPLTNEEISIPEVPSRRYLIMPVFRGAESSHNWQLDITLLSDERRWRYMIFHPDKTRGQYVDNLFFKTSYCDEMIFTTTNDGRTLVLDAASRKKLYTIPPLNDDPCTVSYIIESCGEILGLSWEYIYERSQSTVPPFNFRIYKLNLEGEKGQPCWVEMSNIGDQIVFLDYMSGFSVRATGGLKGYCIYFIFENCASFMFYNGSQLWRYDFGTGTCEQVPCPFERCTWFVPNLR